MNLNYISEIGEFVAKLDLQEEGKKRDVNAFQYGDRRLFTITKDRMINLIFSVQCEQNIDLLNSYIEQNFSFLNLNSDLVAGQYEGGLKVWEATEDLIRYLNFEPQTDRTVLDVGCGAGLLGVCALLSGAKQVAFADYNEQVLQWFTLPNILINLLADQKTLNESIEIVANKCNFLPGDWSEIQQFPFMHCLNSFDRILSSETIYSSSNYAKLLTLIQNNLSANGVTLIAAKSHYFGVGGSTFEFEMFVEQDAKMKCESVQSIDASVQREILQVLWK